MKKFLLVFFLISGLILYLSSHPALHAATPEPCPANMCDTAIGKIDVSSPTTVIGKFFSIVLSVAGLGALFLIIYSGYQLIISRADPEIIKGARERLTSAIIGLVFIVFSIVLLTIIGGDILKIPGFESSTKPPTRAPINQVHP